MTGLVIRYEQDIAAHDDMRSYFKGEEFVVADEAAASKFHPFARIVGPENGAPFEREAALPAWYLKRKVAAAAEGRAIPEYVAGEIAANFDRRAKAEAEAKAEDGNTDAVNDEAPTEGEDSTDGEDGADGESDEEAD